MNRIVAIFLLSITTIFISGCGGGGGGTGSPEPQPQPEPDTTPETIQVQPLEAPIGTQVEQQFQVTGISAPITISITGGEYSINGGAFTGQAGTVNNGQTVTVRVTTSTEFSTSVTATVMVGETEVLVTATSEDEDTAPDNINTETMVFERSSLFERSFVINGVNTAVNLNLSVGEYAIDEGEYTSESGEISNGQTLNIRVPTSDDFSQTVIANLTIGSSDFTFNLVTEAEDLVPDSFEFTSQTELSPESVATSNMITLSGMNNASPISIVNGEYSIDGAEFTDEDGFISTSQTLVLRQTTSPEFETTLTTTVSISTLDVNFSTTTHSERTPPEGSITFPWRTTISHEETLVVRGTASDASGISTVTLNGEPVTIDNVSQIDGLEVVEWSHEIVVPEEQTTFELGVTDTKANVSVNNESFVIQKSYETPTSVIVDEQNTRIMGEFSDGLFVYNYVTNEIQKLDDFRSEGYDNICLIPGTDDLLFIYSQGNQYTVRTYNLLSGIISIIGAIPYPDTDYDLNQQAWFNGMDCDENTAYILMEAHLSGGGNTSRIIEIDYSANPTITEILETGDANAGAWTADTLHYSDGKIATAMSYSAGKVTVIDLSGPSLSEASAEDFTVHNIISDFSANKIYVVEEHDLVSIDLLTEDVEIISAGVDYNLFPKASGTKSIDFINNKQSILLGSNWIDSLVEISLDTGERNIFYSESIGNGEKLRSNRKLAVAGDNSAAYMIDSNDDADAILWRVNMETGFREIVWRALTAGSAYARDLSLDDENSVVYFGLDYTINAYDFHEEPFTLETIASNVEGTGAAIGANFNMTLDKSDNRILVLDYSSNALIEVNLETKVRTVLSREGVRGDGPGINIGIAAGLSLSGDRSFVYTSSEADGSIYTIDLESGDRSLFLDECIDSEGADLFTSSQVMDVILDVNQNSLYIPGGFLRRYNIDTGVCELLNQNDENHTDITVSNGRVFGIDTHSLVVIDPQSGANAILSK